MADAETLGTTLGVRDYFGMVKRHLALFFAIIVVFLAVAVWWVSRHSAQYEARAAVLVRTGSNQQLFPPIGNNFGAFTRVPLAELEFVNSDAFAAQVDAPASVSVAAPLEGNQLLFTGRAANPEDAIESANVWAEAYVTVRHQRDLAENQAALAAAQDTLNALEVQKDTVLAPLKPLDDALLATQEPETISQLTTQRLALQQSLADDLSPIENDIRTVGVEISGLTSQARFLTRPDISALVSNTAERARQTAPQPTRDIGLAAVLGLFTAAAAVLLYDNLRDRVIDVDDMRRLIHPLPLLASVAKVRSVQATTGSLDPAVVEGVENLLTSIGLIRRSTGVQVVLLTSANESEGKTATITWLAERAARQGVRVLLIDGDLRRPRVHTALGLPLEPGLFDLARSQGESPPEDFIVALEGPEGWRLDVVPAGRSDEHAVTVLRDGDIGIAIQKFRDHYDLILIDSPPLLPVTDALVLCELVADGVVILGRAGKTKRSELQQALKAVQTVDVQLLGGVLVGDRRRSSYYG